MVKTTLIFIPTKFQSNKSGHIEGFYKEYKDCDAYYIINNTPLRETPHNIGYVTNGANKPKTKDFKGLYYDNSNQKWDISNRSQISTPNFVKVLYDYDYFRKSECINSDEKYGVHFRFLVENLKKHRHKTKENGKKSYLFRTTTATLFIINWFLNIFEKGKLLWSYSATFSHFYDNTISMQWMLSELTKEKRFTPKIGNLIISKFIDLALGIFLLRLFIENEDVVVELIEATRENIIHNFRDLLTYLMGSPIGLKLNYAFNNSLGRFFFYHISLWRIFLITMQPFIKQYFKLLVLPGAFGFSYQIAMISDIVSIATFHVYCIYVYAARLLYLQLKGLWSFWRLFIGRKYNPLRVRVDSFQYSQHQLFIGTLGFTVLLFLLPTTIMYYGVFVIFRLIIMIVEEILIKIRYLLHCLPIYVVVLWILQSPNLTGPICLKVKKTKDGVASFEAQLKMLPLCTVIRDYAPNTIKWSLGLSWSKIYTGVLL